MSSKDDWGDLAHLLDARVEGSLTEPPETVSIQDDIDQGNFSVSGEWLVVAVEECTCGSDGIPAHMNGCGIEPVGQLVHLIEAESRIVKLSQEMDVHFECDCVPFDGPPHCHGCGEAFGNITTWEARDCVAALRIRLNETK